MLKNHSYVHVCCAGVVPALLLLLDPLQSPCAVENAAKALGNLSADAACRALIRSSGGVGSLSRLLRDDCAASMQVCNGVAVLLASTLFRRAWLCELLLPSDLTFLDEQPAHDYSFCMQFAAGSCTLRVLCTSMG